MEMQPPQERDPRWMNDKDCEQNLVLAEVNLNKPDAGQIELVYLTPLQERIRRTTDSKKPEYNFLYNALGPKDWTGCRVMYAVKKGVGRVPISAERP